MIMDQKFSTVKLTRCLAAGLAMAAISTAACAQGAAPGFHVDGNKIIGPNGSQFVPYGFVLECMAKTNLDKLCMPTEKRPYVDTDKIRAAASFWHANIVRFQVAQETLFNQSPYNAKYLGLVDQEVNLANSLGLVVTITLQEEEYKGDPLPTISAIPFWRFMADHFKNNPHVFFDLYNEPRLRPADAGGEDRMWDIWQHGGPAIPGVSSAPFVGMQALVDTIRHEGANNIIIAEANFWDSDLSGVRGHRLNGSNIAYGVEPNLSRKDRTPDDWVRNFGQYAREVPIVPEAFLDYYGSNTCDENSPSDVPRLFSYLKQLNMGLIVWTLNPGVLTVGNNLEQPTSYGTAATIDCPVHQKKHAYPNNTLGAGEDILNYFRTNSVKAF